MPAQAGDFFAEKQQQEQHYLAQLREALPHLPVEEVVLQRLEVAGEDGIRALAGMLRAE